LFLDEIGDMPVMMQAKLLRVLEESQVERIGGDRTIPVNVRVLVATHRNLEELVRSGVFRQDLYHRIYVFPLRLPPLRERTEDIPVLVEHFTRQLSEQNGWKPKPVTAAAIAELEHYPWPGNVRELRNVVERLLLLAGDEVQVGDVRLALPQSAAAMGGYAGSTSTGTLTERVESFEREVLLGELKRNSQHMTETARALGLERSHLYKKCQQLGIDLRALRKGEGN
jgi:two-component system nitrogen regulation response regulator NtrX